MQVLKKEMKLRDARDAVDALAGFLELKGFVRFDSKKERERIMREAAPGIVERFKVLAGKRQEFKLPSPVPAPIPIPAAKKRGKKP